VKIMATQKICNNSSAMVVNHFSNHSTSQLEATFSFLFFFLYMYESDEFYFEFLYIVLNLIVEIKESVLEVLVSF